MSARTRVTLDMRKLEALARNLDGDCDKAVEAVAQQAVGHVKAVIVEKDIVDTAALLNTIHVEAPVQRMTRTISDGVHYGVYQEFGTYKMPARPFMLTGILRAVDGFGPAVTEWVFDE